MATRRFAEREDMAAEEAAAAEAEAGEAGSPAEVYVVKEGMEKSLAPAMTLEEKAA